MSNTDKYAGLWIATSFFGSAAIALIPSFYSFFFDPITAFMLFFMILILSLIFSLIASIPVFIYSLLLPKGILPRSIWKRIRNFQIILYGLIQLGFACYFFEWDSFSINGEFWLLPAIMTVYLITGFIVWKRGIVPKSLYADTSQKDDY